MCGAGCFARFASQSGVLRLRESRCRSLHSLRTRAPRRFRLRRSVHWTHAPLRTLTTVQEGRIISALVLDIDKFQAFDRLVSSSSMRYRTSTDDLSPCRLQGVSHACAPGIFFLRWVSRLDAFSVYPVRTSLPCYAVGTTTVAPEVRPFRSSRTRNSAFHDSYAHDG